MNLNVDIKNAFEALTQIGDVSSTKAKQEILKVNQDNTVLKGILFAAYSPFLQYNIKKIPVAVEDLSKKDIDISNFGKFTDLLVRLEKRQVTGNAAIESVSNFLFGCCPEEHKWYSRVIEKDLGIGLADKGINRVFKGLIPVYEVLLADKIAPEDLNLDTPKALKMLPNRIVTQYKIDGYRLNIHVSEQGEVAIRTRNGKFVTGYTDLEREAAEKLPRGYVYDGEIVAPELFDWIGKNLESEESVTANRDLFAEVMSHAFSKEENKKGIFNMFDMIPIKEWKTHKTTETLETRTKRIREVITPLNLNQIVIVPTSRVYYKNNPEDRKEIVEQFHQFLNVGWEGLMIKNYDSVYEFKRSKNLLKMKLMLSEDLEVQRILEGGENTKYKGMMGAAVVAYRASDGNVYEVNVGSGWSDDQRLEFWQNPNKIIGKIIEVSYQAETSNKNGGYSLSFPVFKCIREDK